MYNIHGIEYLDTYVFSFTGVRTLDLGASKSVQGSEVNQERSFTTASKT